MNQEIDLFLKSRHKQNKMLAKNVAEWVDQAMEINAKLKESGKMVIEDIDMDSFDEEYEDEIMEEKSTEECEGKRNSGD